MPDETLAAAQSQRLGKLAASKSLTPDARKQLVSTQARIPSTTGVEQAISKEQNRQALAGFKHGGRVKKTGVYKLHKGERVLTKKQQARSKRA